MYNNGEGVDKDYNKAIELYQQAANLGNSYAQYNLAVMYENGGEIEKDIDQAIYWYIRSAKQGDQDAKDHLERLKKGNNLIEFN
jgi:TPR repeat protein